MRFSIYAAPKEVAKPKPEPIRLIDWQLKLVPHTASGAMRVIAVTPSGERIPHGNLLKFKKDGTVYRYHTVNPALGLSLTSEGRIKEAV